MLRPLAGLYSQVKRAPKAKIKRKTFETPGPAAAGAMSLDERARQLFAYMKNYNYEVKSTGDVITFTGNYRSTRGQAAAITFYMLVGMICCGLVLSIAAPGGNLWYGLVLLTPLAPWYYYKNADRCVILISYLAGLQLPAGPSACGGVLCATRDFAEHAAYACARLACSHVLHAKASGSDRCCSAACAVPLWRAGIGIGGGVAKRAAAVQGGRVQHQNGHVGRREHRGRSRAGAHTTRAVV